MVQTTIGRYVITGEVGAGGFATVYRAHDPTLDRDVALKVLHPHLARDPAIRDRFIREGRSLARVHHPNLVQVYDAGESDGQVYLAMQFIPGRPLAALAWGGQIPLAELAPLIAQVAAALEEIHAAGLVHRDVKPANILAADTGRAVLLDLGIARDVNSSTVTSSSMIVGTPGYLAPEQVDTSIPVGPQTDVYQLGATVYALLAGRPPFEGDTAQVLYGVVHLAPPDLGELRPDLPPSVVGTVAEAMAKDPARRPQGPLAFARALAAGSDVTAALPAIEAPTRPSPPRATPAMTVQRPRPAAGAGPSLLRRPLVIGAAAGAIAVLLAGGVLLARGGDGKGGNRDDKAKTEATAAAGTTGIGLATPAPGDTKGDAKGGGLTASGPSLTVTVEEQGTPARVPFEGKAGQIVSLGVTRVTVGTATQKGAYISILDPDGREVVSRQWVSKDGGTIAPPALRGSGTYVVVVDADKGGSGSLALTLSQPVTGTLAVDGQPATVTIDRPGQHALLSFEGQRGQLLAVGVTRVTVGDTNPNGAYLAILDPDRRPVVDRTWIAKDGGAITAPALRAAGTYTVVVAADRAETGNVTLILSQPVTGTLAVDGQSLTLTIDRPGQFARLTFEGKKDQRLSLGVDRITVGGTAPNGVYVSILDPDGRPVVERSWVNRDGESVAMPQLRATGTYVAVIDPDRTDTGNAILTLSQPVTGTLGTDGQPLMVELGRPGQKAWLTFEGRQGQDLSRGVARAALGPAGRDGVRVTIIAPDGKRLIERNWMSRDGANVNTKPLPANGTYTVVVEPERTDTGTVTFALKPAAP